LQPDVLFNALTPSGRRIRLTKKVWAAKIQQHHPEFVAADYMLDLRQALEAPDFVVQGWAGELIALRCVKPLLGVPSIFALFIGN